MIKFLTCTLVFSTWEIINVLKFLILKLFIETRVFFFLKNSFMLSWGHDSEKGEVQTAEMKRGNNY